MTGTTVQDEAIDIEALVREVERYLAAVETFRREGCEPRWADEGPVAVEPLWKSEE